MIGAQRRAQIAERDARIVAAYQAGELQDAIAGREAISRAMVSVVLKKHDARLDPEAAFARMREAGLRAEVVQKRSASNSRPLAERFYAKLVKGEAPDACWIWTGSLDGVGYPQIGYEGKTRRASHIALLLDGRPRPKGLNALHRCDAPLCVNPAHLWWGTQRDNMHDAIAKGRFNFDGLAFGQRRGSRTFAEPCKPGQVIVTLGAA